MNETNWGYVNKIKPLLLNNRSSRFIKLKHMFSSKRIVQLSYKNYHLKVDVGLRITKQNRVR